MSENHEKVCRTLNYFEYFFSAVGGQVSYQEKE